ncbi:50S ribosomal protein L29 [Candidatus Gottesmanbacteria bacterium]|nr:50S ribosomal protein L29 [Candidatus Gottesmanbacteria bacterium]
MKKSQIKELNAKTEAELNKMLSSQKEDLAKIMIELQSKKLKNVALVTNKKKMIAVISTKLTEKELAKV